MITGESDPFRQADVFRRLGADTVVITMGGDGAVLVNEFLARAVELNSAYAMRLSVGLTLDVSHVRFDDDFIAAMKPAMEQAFDAMDALEQVDMARLATRPVTTLSVGERQLVFVARAIAQTPELLLLDEPASFLDLKHRAQLIRVLRRLCDERGITALVVTHDLMFLQPSFDEVFALSEGRVAAHGDPRFCHAAVSRLARSAATSSGAMSSVATVIDASSA